MGTGLPCIVEQAAATHLGDNSQLLQVHNSCSGHPCVDKNLNPVTGGRPVLLPDVGDDCAACRATLERSSGSADCCYITLRSTPAVLYTREGCPDVLDVLRLEEEGNISLCHVQGHSGEEERGLQVHSCLRQLAIRRRLRGGVEAGAMERTNLVGPQPCFAAVAKRGAAAGVCRALWLLR